MRLFIALPISEQVKKEIDNHTKQLAEIQEAKFVPSYNWHFTLVFLGEQDKRDVPGIEKALEDVVKNQKNLTVQLDKITYGPNPKNPRMVWIRTDEESDEEMGKLKNNLVSSLQSQGINWKKSNYKFKGHITLARFKNKNIKKLPDIETKMKVHYKPSSLKLIKSKLTKRGALYETIKEVQF